MPSLDGRANGSAPAGLYQSELGCAVCCGQWGASEHGPKNSQGGGREGESGGVCAHDRIPLLGPTGSH